MTDYEETARANAEAHLEDAAAIDAMVRRSRRANRDARPVMTDSEAYAILTRDIVRLKSQERDAFDRSDAYRPALDAVQAGNTGEALRLIINAGIITDAGNAWREKTKDMNMGHSRPSQINIDGDNYGNISF